MPDEMPTNYTELAVAIGRVEEGVKGLKDSIDGLVKTTKGHADTLTRHEVEIEILKSRQAPRVHWLTIIVGIVAVAGFVIGLLNQLYLK